MIDPRATVAALRRFFALVLLLSWGVGGAYVFARLLTPSLPPFGDNPLVLFFIACAPSLAAIISAVRERSLPALLQGLVRSFNPIWLIVSFAFLPLLALGLTIAAQAFGVIWNVQANDITWRLPLLLFTTAQIVTNLGPLGEELGWRGYALPRLLAITTPLRASLVLGAAWCVWHVPAFFIGGLMVVGIDGFAWWCVATLALTIVMTWLYLRANGNIVVSGIVPHFVINGAGVLGVWSARPAEALALLALAMLIVSLGGLRQPGPRSA